MGAENPGQVPLISRHADAAHACYEAKERVNCEPGHVKRIVACSENQSEEDKL